MSDHLACRIPVGNDHTVPTPLVTEDILEEPLVTCRRDTVDFVERSHKSSGTSLCSSLECREISVAERALRNHCAVVVTSTFCGTVTYKVLDAGSKCCRIAQVISLITLYHCDTHLDIEIRVLTRALCYTAPTWVTGNIKHWRECPSDTGSSCLYS